MMIMVRPPPPMGMPKAWFSHGQETNDVIPMLMQFHGQEYRHGGTQRMTSHFDRGMVIHQWCQQGQHILQYAIGLMAKSSMDLQFQFLIIDHVSLQASRNVIPQSGTMTKDLLSYSTIPQ